MLINTPRSSLREIPEGIGYLYVQRVESTMFLRVPVDEDLQRAWTGGALTDSEREDASNADERAEVDAGG